MDQDVTNELTTLDTKINNLGLIQEPDSTTLDKIKDINTRRTAITAKELSFKQAEMKRLEDFRREIKSDIASLITSIDNLQR